MNSPVQIIDDEEEDFDWEAAVREIDVACQSSSTKAQRIPLVKNGSNHQLNKVQNNCRQLKLDEFLSNGVSKSSTVNEVGVRGKDEEIKVQERGCYVDIDPEAAKTWIYPDNVPRREYQVAITKTALFSNTLVALPTGLGKTLIAAVIMFNYFRWFPEGKVVFAAPSRPLVMQQIEACHNIVGIPQEWTIDMTGLITPSKRVSFWKSKRVFFVTPQVLEKDIQTGACLVKYLVCLVIDEAHRAMGNYSYCVAVRELLAAPVEMRILALTATPGSKKETIQQVIDNLQISTLEYRSESDADVCPYVQNRTIELIEVPLGKDADEINNLLTEVMRPIAGRLCAMGVLTGRDFQTLSPCDLLNSRDKFRQAPPLELSHAKYFARLMSRNEAIQRAKILMQKSLSHGAPSPKLSKMIEILVDHFRKNDPQKSRVIIFSNFRGSVRDILDSLAHIGHLVKATQFIGQSSGKTLKGQTQKVQQAVLEKFRMGGYNVIVATSIGEEGLDIMEVDLVICFDANISPLRMIQRMGRTGRKRDGRVVVLACEGTELKGYKRKQATGKTVRKHLQNGGMNVFNFHCSPRMVPHLFKPELQFVEISIEKFVRQIKKVKVHSPQQLKFRERLSDDEAALLEKYFLPSETIKPSLVAFPYFQAYPSRVHKVMHSSRTGWLIDAMQLLQGLSFSDNGRKFGCDFSRRTQCLQEGVENHTESGQDVSCPVNLVASQIDISEAEVSPSDRSLAEEYILDSPDRQLHIEVPIPATSPPDKHMMPSSSIQDTCNVHLVERYDSSSAQKMLGASVEASVDDVIVHTSPYDEKYPEESSDSEIADGDLKSPVTPAAQCLPNIANSDFSPHLTSFMENGFVPESPLSNAGEDIVLSKRDDVDWQSGEGKDVNLVSELISTPKPCANLLTDDKKVSAISSSQRMAVKPSVGNEISMEPSDIQSKLGGALQSSSSPEFRTPLQNLTNSSCSKDWQMSSQKKSASNERPSRLKRLRRIGDVSRERWQNHIQRSACSVEVAFEVTDVQPNVMKHTKVRKSFKDARDFIDEEAEVSSEGVAPDSEDEGVCEDSDAYEESFIDDQSDSAIGSGQTDSKLDMMAIYRRSLLTQSPFQAQQKHYSVDTPESLPSGATMGVVGECSGRTCSLETPHSCLKSPNIFTRNLADSHLHLIPCEAIPSSSKNVQSNLTNTESCNRILISSRAFNLPAKNLEKEFCSDSALPNKETLSSYQTNGIDTGCASFLDDQFYEGLDLDELEAQATKLLSQKTGSSAQKRRFSELSAKNKTLFSSPLFDLGI
ncbi:DEAD-box ATP-dependent RNA helicase FANCM isoform X2 [Amaranthus tricolor]|uniref:DEAD-box ATP-dependent RNA helicase FANCM isoform X2 n=1 Tax=Amaranthus tricolor TaxID=29722 RepID=UPI0025884F74|nr:DEAD-box ATP-dependent RNA helicase FANCM isoform X2 [Amaranthus tricolor]